MSRGETIVILGFGAIAQRLVELLAPFEMRVTALRRRAREDETVPIVSFAELPDALVAAAHVVNILPANADSERFINAERIAQMQAGAVFYNIGRGATVDQGALAEALRAGHLGGPGWMSPTRNPCRMITSCCARPGAISRRIPRAAMGMKPRRSFGISWKLSGGALPDSRCAIAFFELSGGMTGRWR